MYEPKTNTKFVGNMQTGEKKTRNEDIDLRRVEEKVQQILDSRGSRTYQIGIVFGLIVGTVLVLIGDSLCVAGVSVTRIDWIPALMIEPEWHLTL